MIVEQTTISKPGLHPKKITLCIWLNGKGIEYYGFGKACDSKDRNHKQGSELINNFRLHAFLLPHEKLLQLMTGKFCLIHPHCCLFRSLRNCISGVNFTSLQHLIYCR